MREKTGKKYHRTTTNVATNIYVIINLTCKYKLFVKPNVTEIAPSRAPCGIPTKIIKRYLLRKQQSLTTA